MQIEAGVVALQKEWTKLEKPVDKDGKAKPPAWDVTQMRPRKQGLAEKGSQPVHFGEIKHCVILNIMNDQKQNGSTKVESFIVVILPGMKLVI